MPNGENHKKKVDLKWVLGIPSSIVAVSAIYVAVTSEIGTVRDLRDLRDLHGRDISALQKDTWETQRFVLHTRKRIIQFELTVLSMDITKVPRREINQVELGKLKDELIQIDNWIREIDKRISEKEDRSKDDKLIFRQR